MRTRAIRLLLAVGVGMAAVGCAPHDDPPGRDPCDAANSTADSFRDATNAFHLAVPADAADVSFATSEGGTAYSLTLVFRTTPDGLAHFYEASKFPAPVPVTDPKPAGRQMAAGIPKCDLDHDFTYSAIVGRDSTYPGLLRSLALDDTDSGAPRVLVVAAVL